MPDTDLTTTLKMIDQASGVARSAAANVKGALSGIPGAAAPANVALGTVDGHIVAMGSHGASMGHALATGLGLPLSPAHALAEGVGFLKEQIAHAVEVSIEWQQTMQQVQANTGLSTTVMQGLDIAIQTTMQHSNAGFDQLAEGAAHVANFGFKTASEQTLILDASMKSATSTGGNLSMTAELVANMLHEYGASAQEALRYTDMIHVSATHANATFEQFAQSEGKVVGTAANLKVPLDQVNAAMAALTQHGYGADDAATGLQNILTHLVNPAQEVRTELGRLNTITGVDLPTAFSAAGLAHNGLTGTMRLLKEAYEKMGFSEEQAAQESMLLLNAQRGGLPMATLLGTGARDYATTLQAQAAAMTGLSPTQAAYNEATQTTAYQQGILSNNLQLLAKDFGDGLNPAVLKATEGLNALATNDHVKQFITSLGQGLGDLADALLVVVDRAGDMGTALNDAGSKAFKQTNLKTAVQESMVNPMTEGAVDVTATLHKMDSDSESILMDMATKAGKNWGTMTDAQKGALRDQVNAAADAHADMDDHMSALRDTMIARSQETRDGVGSETRGMVADVADALDPMPLLGGSSGSAFMDSLVQSLSSRGPDLGKFWTDLQTVMDQEGAMGALGHNVGASYGYGFVRGVRDQMALAAGSEKVGLYTDPEIGKVINSNIKALEQQAVSFKTMAASAAPVDNAAIWKKARDEADAAAAASKRHDEADAAHDRAAANRAAAADRRAAAAEKRTEREAAAKEKAAVREADAILRAQQTTIAALGKAAEAGQTSGDVLVAAMAGVKSAAEGDLPAVGAVWQRAVTDLQNGANLTTVQANLRAGIQRLTSDPNASIAAWAKQQADHLQELDDATAVKAQKIATDLLKSQQSVISGFGKIASDVAAGTATTGDLLVALMEGAPAAAAAHLPHVAAVYKGMLAEMQSATPPSLATLHDQFRAAMQALVADPDASIAAWARQQLDALDQADQELAAKHQKEIDDWSAAERTAAQARQDARDADAKKAQDAADALAAAQIATVQGMAAAAQAVASGKNPLDVIIGLIPVLQQATAAGMPQVAALIQHWMDVAAKGGTVSLDEMRGGMADLLNPSGGGGGQGALYAQQAQAAVAAAQQQAAVNAQVAQYEQEIKAATASLAPWQAAIDQTKASLDESNQALQEAQAVAQGYQTQLQGAQTALNNFRNAQLQGEGAGKGKLHENQKQQDLLSLEQARLEDGPKTAASVTRLREIKKELEELQKQQKIQQLEQKTTFDEQHYQLGQIGQDTHELTFSEAQAGATQAAADVTVFTARLADANARVADAKAAQEGAKLAADAATASYAAQKQVVDAQIASYKAQEDALKSSADATTGMATGMGTVATAAQTTATTLTQTLPQITTALTQTQTTLATTAPQLTATLAALGPAVQTGLGGVATAWNAVFGGPNQEGSILWSLFNHQPNSFKTLVGLYFEQMLDTLYINNMDPGLHKVDDQVTLFLHETLAPDVRIGGQAVGAALGAGGVEGLLGSIPDGQAAGRAWADAIMQAAKDEAGVKSPAAKWRDHVGRQQGAGGALGITESIPQGQAAGRAWAQAAQQAAGGVGPLGVPGGGIAGAGMPALPRAGGGNTTHHTNIYYQGAPGETPTQSAANGQALAAAFNERTMVDQGRNRGYGR